MNEFCTISITKSWDVKFVMYECGKIFYIFEGWKDALKWFLCMGNGRLYA
jgi:hypothetical protein